MRVRGTHFTAKQMQLSGRIYGCRLLAVKGEGGTNRIYSVDGSSKNHAEIRVSSGSSENGDVNIVVRPLQQHFTLEVDDFPLLCKEGKNSCGAIGERREKVTLETWHAAT